MAARPPTPPGTDRATLPVEGPHNTANPTSERDAGAPPATTAERIDLHHVDTVSRQKKKKKKKPGRGTDQGAAPAADASIVAPALPVSSLPLPSSTQSIKGVTKTLAAPGHVPYRVQFGPLLEPNPPPLGALRADHVPGTPFREFIFDEQILIAGVAAALHPDPEVCRTFDRVVDVLERAALHDRDGAVRLQQLMQEQQANQVRINLATRGHGSLKHANDEKRRLVERFKVVLQEIEVIEESDREPLARAKAVIASLSQGILADTWHGIFPAAADGYMANAPINQLHRSADVLRELIQQTVIARQLPADHAVLRSAQQLLDIADEIIDNLRGFGALPEIFRYCVVHHAQLRQLTDLLGGMPSEIRGEISGYALLQSDEATGKQRRAADKARQRAADHPSASWSAAATGKPHAPQSVGSSAEGAAAAATVHEVSIPHPVVAIASPHGAAGHAEAADAADAADTPFSLVVRQAFVRDPATGKARPITTCTPREQTLDAVWDRWAPGTWPTTACCAAYHFGKHAVHMVRPDMSIRPTVEEYTDIAWQLIQTHGDAKHVERRDYLRAALDGAAGIEARAYRAYYTHDGRNFVIFIRHIANRDDVKIVSAGKYEPIAR